MKKKKSFAIAALILLAVAVLAVAAYFLLIRKSGGSRAMQLDELSTDGEYQFGGLAWGASQMETEFDR